MGRLERKQRGLFFKDDIKGQSSVIFSAKP